MEDFDLPPGPDPNEGFFHRNEMAIILFGGMAIIFVLMGVILPIIFRLSLEDGKEEIIRLLES